MFGRTFLSCRPITVSGREGEKEPYIEERETDGLLQTAERSNANEVGPPLHPNSESASYFRPDNDSRRGAMDPRILLLTLLGYFCQTLAAVAASSSVCAAGASCQSLLSLSDIAQTTPFGQPCVCYRSECGGGKKSLRYYLDLDGGRKLIIEKRYCQEVVPERRCEWGETAAEVVGSDFLALDLYRIHCRCPTTTPMSQTSGTELLKLIHMNYTCELPLCEKSEECARVYESSSGAPRARTFCRCPKRMFCPTVHLSTEETRRSANGNRYTTINCLKEENAV